MFDLLMHFKCPARVRALNRSRPSVEAEEDFVVKSQQFALKFNINVWIKHDLKNDQGTVSHDTP